MCVILNIEPGASIPDDKLALACDINKDGYGISYVDRGRLVVDHVIKVPNDPELIQKRLQGLKKHRVFLHLRHATVGAVNRANAHPFLILTKNVEGIDLGLMHNGTLGNWTPAKESTDSDTQYFANYYVKPFALRCLSALGKKKTVLQDEFFKWMLEREAKPYSTMLVFDSLGSWVQINNEKWKQFDGFTASNDYSFDEQHWRSSKRKTQTYGNYGNYGNYGHNSAYQAAQTFLSELPLEDQKAHAAYLAEWEEELTREHGGESSAAKEKKSVQRLQYEMDKVADEITSTKWGTQSMTQVNSFLFTKLNVDRTPFHEQAGLNSLKDVGRLSVKQLEELNEHFPQAMAQLYIDLIGECHRLEEEIKKLEASPVG